MKNKLILNENTKFDEAIALLDDNGNGVLPVVDKLNKLIGIITDGDIRKAILNKNLDLKHIINNNPYKLNVNTSKIKCIQYLKKIKRRQVPLVDNEGNYITMFTLDEVEFNNKPNAVVIMAGGLGTRLGELTKNTPKPMLHVGSKPILEIIIEKFIEFGFNKFYISVNYKKEIIKDYFENGEKLGVEILYLEEDKRLGTGGALSLIKEDLSESIVVTNGDVLSNVDFDVLLNYHESKSSPATMCVREYEHIIPYGVVDTKNDKIISLSEKPQIKFNINTGIYILSPESVKKIPKNQYFELPTLFENIIEDGQDPYFYKIVDYWIDIGQKEEYIRANNDIDTEKF